MSLQLVPLSQRQARAFITEHHRHNGAPQGDVIRVGLELDGTLIAVGTAGRPVAAGLQDGTTLEITRICTQGHDSACTRLYGALTRAAKALGYTRAITYTLASEPGASPRAAGFTATAAIPARDWAAESGRDCNPYSENLLGERTTPAGPKIRWERAL